ncbi:MAG: cysteine dioxygenase family protein [Bacteroidia bacterium]|nr:cysteine dioxygenase family protein [Bacteroidia bacterium]
MIQNRTKFDVSLIENIDTLRKLVELLKQGQFDDITSQLATISIPCSAFSPYASWEETRYTRNCIAHNDEFELVLLCWPPHLGTDIHGHDEKECWVKILNGEFEEHTYERTGDSFEPTGTRRLNQFEVTDANDKTFLHSLKNVSSEHAMSLHLYMAPIKRCDVYDTDEEKFKSVSLTYDTVVTEFS